MKSQQSGIRDLKTAKEAAQQRPGLAGVNQKSVRPKRSAGCSTPSRPAARRPTVISAKVDVGFGNVLYIRGEGAGLSWNKGQALECVGASNWKWASLDDRGAITFKLLINDQLWSHGENMIAAPGVQVDVVPAF